MRPRTDRPDELMRVLTAPAPRLRVAGRRPWLHDGSDRHQGRRPSEPVRHLTKWRSRHRGAQRHRDRCLVGTPLATPPWKRLRGRRARTATSGCSSKVPVPTSAISATSSPSLSLCWCRVLRQRGPSRRDRPRSRPSMENGAGLPDADAGGAGCKSAAPPALIATPARRQARLGPVRLAVLAMLTVVPNAG